VESAVEYCVGSFRWNMALPDGTVFLTSYLSKLAGRHKLAEDRSSRNSISLKKVVISELGVPQSHGRDSSSGSRTAAAASHHKRGGSAGTLAAAERSSSSTPMPSPTPSPNHRKKTNGGFGGDEAGSPAAGVGGKSSKEPATRKARFPLVRQKMFRRRNSVSKVQAYLLQPMPERWAFFALNLLYCFPPRFSFTVA